MSFTQGCLALHRTRQAGAECLRRGVDLLKTYPEAAPGVPAPPLAAAMTRADHRFEDALVLATLETMTDSIMNLRQMKMSGVEADQVSYLQCQRTRIDFCLDWLETKATCDGFAPGRVSRSWTSI
jgi:hypothetical protein